MRPGDVGRAGWLERAVRLPVRLLWGLFLIGATDAVHAQEALMLPRLQSTIQFDGLSDEPAWAHVAPLPLTMYQPTFQGSPTERTEVRLVYDATYLYAAIRCYDTQPASIRANSLYRDRLSGDDTFTLILDTFNDDENALSFSVNPAGVRLDAAIFNDAEGFNPINIDWNTFWDVETVQNEQGWFAEVRIPFSSLRFQNAEGHVTMGLIAYRYIARKNERLIFPPIPPNWNNGYMKPSRAQDVVLQNVDRRRPVYITPYALGGLGQSAALNETRTRFRYEAEPAHEVGLDLKYNVTDNLTLDVTLNTDFAQVEADNQQVNLTRFSLFFPEKRQFFQERAAIFDFNMGGTSRLFHSRRIGLTEQGEAIRILGGARLIGRVGGWDLGLIDMQTARDAGQPTENFGVVRVRRQLWNTNSYIGGMMTSRLAAGGGYNLAYGLDGLVRLFDDEYLTLRWAQTFEDAPEENSLRAGRFLFNWRRRKDIGWHYEASLVWSGAAYKPGIGYLDRTHFTQLKSRLVYDWLAPGPSKLRRLQPSLTADIFLRNEDGSTESATVEWLTQAELKSGTWIFFVSTLQYEDLRSPFALSDEAEIPVGRYTFVDVWAGYIMSSAHLFRLRLDGRFGSFYDGWLMRSMMRLTWNMSPFWELQGEYLPSIGRFPDHDQHFTAHLARLRIQGALNTRFSINAFLQYSSSAKRISINARLRYHFREGNDLWLVYNEGLNTERQAHAFGLPLLPLSDSRTVLLKYTYTFRL